MNTLKIISSPLCPLILIAATATLTCGTAAAGTADAAPQRVVSFGDLNLDSPAGVKTLYGRLNSAARAVCRPASAAPYVLWAQSRKCTHNALSDAVATIDNPNLTAYVGNRMQGRSVARERVASRR